MTTLAELKTLVRRNEQMASLQSKLNEYWEAFDPLFDWTPAEKTLRSASFLRREVVPRREAALTIAQQIEELNNGNLDAQRKDVAARYAAFRGDLHRLLWQTVALGLGVAVIVVFRLRVRSGTSLDLASLDIRTRGRMMSAASDSDVYQRRLRTANPI